MPLCSDASSSPLAFFETWHALLLTFFPFFYIVMLFRFPPTLHVTRFGVACRGTQQFQAHPRSYPSRDSVHPSNDTYIVPFTSHCCCFFLYFSRQQYTLGGEGTKTNK
uniref:Uncharacterized protein n=1 Tax=Trypanosoma vivax (strain Y486) TaxID=1055687 RepID=G0U560_TRYVY|nr:hypothetical protein TVY486_1000620 [Trypanosoma vivax Y486]